MFVLVSIIVLLLVVAIFVLRVRFNSGRTLVNGAEVSAISKHFSGPILGHLPLMRGAGERWHIPLETLGRAVVGHGLGYMEVPVFAKRMLMVADPKLAEEILQHRPEHFERNDAILLSARNAHSSGKVSLFAATGTDWREQRKAFAPTFAATNVRPFVEAIRNTLAEVEDKILREGLVSTSDAGNYTLDVILQFAYNVRLTDVEGARIRTLSTKLLTVVRDRLAKGVLNLWATPLWRLIPSERLLRLELRPSLNAIAQKLLDTPSETGFIARTASMDPDLRVLNADLSLIAGHETTAATASWILNLLARDAALRMRILQEVLHVCPSGWRHLTQSDLNHTRLPLTHTVVNEVLRTKPPGVIIGFSCVREFETTDSQGRRVLIPVGENGFVMTRLLDTLASGEEIDLSADPTRKTLAFGAGPRICPGKSLALQELLLWTAMLSAHDLNPISDTEPDEDNYFTMVPSPFEIKIGK